MCNALNNMYVHRDFLMNNAKVNKLFHQSKQEFVFKHLSIALLPCMWTILTIFVRTAFGIMDLYCIFADVMRQ